MATQGDSTDPAVTATADRLADAAISIIARDGFDALSVRRVAREAAVTGGTVQHHYPSKVDLTVAALDRTVSRQAHRISLLPPSESPITQLTSELCAMLPADPASTEEAVVWIAMSAAVPGHPFVAERRREAAEQARRWIASRIRRSQDAGIVNAAIDPEVVGPMIEAALDGVMLQAVAKDDSLRVSCQRLCDIVDRVLQIPPS